MTWAAPLLQARSLILPPEQPGPHGLAHRAMNTRGDRNAQMTSLGRHIARQVVVLEALAQHGLLDLPSGGVGNLVDEDHVVRKPPLGNLALYELENLALGRRLILFEHDDQQRPLVPFRMLDANHRGFRHLWMSDGKVLEVDRRD